MKNWILLSALLSLLCGCSAMDNTFIGAEAGTGFYSMSKAVEAKQSEALFDSSSSTTDATPAMLIMSINPINASTEQLCVVGDMPYIVTQGLPR